MIRLDHESRLHIDSAPRREGERRTERADCRTAMQAFDSAYMPYSSDHCEPPADGHRGCARARLVPDQGRRPDPSRPVWQGRSDVVLARGGRFNKESWKKQAEAFSRTTRRAKGDERANASSVADSNGVPSRSETRLKANLRCRNPELDGQRRPSATTSSCRAERTHLRRTANCVFGPTVRDLR